MKVKNVAYDFIDGSKVIFESVGELWRVAVILPGGAAKVFNPDAGRAFRIASEASAGSLLRKFRREREYADRLNNLLRAGR